MGIKELAEKIYTSIQNRQTSTTSILRDVRMLGKMMKTREFEWVESELKGYNQEKENIPIYRYADAIESKTWTTHLDTTLQKIYSSFLKQSNWTKWMLGQSVSELEDLLSTGYIRNTGKILKVLGLRSSLQTPIYQVITVNGQAIKKVLDQIQDKVQSQITDVITSPNLTVPSIAIFLIYIEILPETKEDFEIISEFVENSKNHVLASRSCRPILHSLIKYLVKKPIPKNYVFTDNVKLTKASEKSKIKYYLELKGESLYGDKKKIVFLDENFRELYEISSKADKNKVNIYEANLCIDLFIKFLEKLYRYTDLKEID